MLFRVALLMDRGALCDSWLAAHHQRGSRSRLCAWVPHPSVPGRACCRPLPRWVTTPAYDPSNRRHVAIVDEIIIGNGLPVSGLGLMQGSAPSPAERA